MLRKGPRKLIPGSGAGSEEKHRRSAINAKSGGQIYVVSHGRTTPHWTNAYNKWR